MIKRGGRRSPLPPNTSDNSWGNPRGNYRSPNPTTYPYPPRNRSAEIITISLLVAAFMLLGLGGMLWLVQTRLNGALWGPTPTPTPTRGLPATSTPDFMATRVAEDFLTQQAFQMAMLGTATHTPMVDETLTPEPDNNTLEATDTPVIVHLPGVISQGTNEPVVDAEGSETNSPLETPTLGNIVNLPMVVGDSSLATPTPVQIAELPTEPVEPTPTETPTETPPIEIPTETPTFIPTETPIPVEVLPTATPTLEPPSPTPTLSNQPFVVASLKGFVETDSAALRLGPSNIYTTVNTIGRGTQVTILNRNPSGEWVYICCISGQADQTPVWVRQAFVRARDNELPGGAPEGANPNDIRWLAIQPPPSYLPAMPTQIPPGPDDFPLARYDRQGSGRVDALPNAPFGPGWGGDARAGLGFVSPVAVMNSNVLVGSADNHLYSFERLTGSQRWRFNLCQDGCSQINFAPMIYDNEIFIADQNRRLWALNEQNGPTLLWRITLPQPAISSLNVYSDTLYIATGEGANHTLLAMHRDNGAVRWSRPSTGPGLRYPIIGDQLIYAADTNLTAYDVINGEQVWENSVIQNITAGPVYDSPGPRGLAELFVVGGDNRIYAIDANTGAELWNIDNGERATTLALNETTLFVGGDGYVKAISRQDAAQLWRSPTIGGQIMGGILVDANRIIVVTQSGIVYLFSTQDGASLTSPSIASSVGGGPALSGPYIYIPGTDGQLYEILGNQ